MTRDVLATSVGNAVHKAFKYADKPATDKETGGWKGVSIELLR